MAKKSFGVVILDEAHKARAARETARRPAKESRTICFASYGQLREAAENVILGTATPIQLDAVELWDLLRRAQPGAPQALGSDEWVREESIKLLTNWATLAA